MYSLRYMGWILEICFSVAVLQAMRDSIKSRYGTVDQKETSLEPLDATSFSRDDNGPADSVAEQAGPMS